MRITLLGPCSRRVRSAMPRRERPAHIRVSKIHLRPCTPQPYGPLRDLDGVRLIGPMANPRAPAGSPHSPAGGQHTGGPTRLRRLFLTHQSPRGPTTRPTFQLPEQASKADAARSCRGSLSSPQSVPVVAPPQPIPGPYLRHLTTGSLPVVSSPFRSPDGVLCTFPSRYLYAIGIAREYLALEEQYPPYSVCTFKQAYSSPPLARPGPPPAYRPLTCSGRVFQRVPRGLS